jgi:predicted transposase YbfD/YdcC
MLLVCWNAWQRSAIIGTGVGIAAVLAGAKSLAAIAEWAADAPPVVLAALGVRRDPLVGAWQVPGETTIRRAFTDLDADALDAVVGTWLRDRQRPPPRWCRRAVAVDGKTLRGDRRDRHQPHLLAAMDHADGTVLAQVQVAAKTNEISGFRPLLAVLDLAGTVVTADALHTQREHAEFLVTAKQADYLFIVKGNQPGLHAQLRSLPWRDIPVANRTRDHGHGRTELRALQVATVPALAFPMPPRRCASPAASTTCAVAGGGPRPSTRSPA